MTTIYFADGTSQDVDHTTVWQHLKTWTHVKTPDGQTYTHEEFDAKSKELCIQAAQLDWDLVRREAWEDALYALDEDTRELALIRDLLTEAGVEAPEACANPTLAQVELLRQQVRCTKIHREPSMGVSAYPLVLLSLLGVFVAYVWSHTSHGVGALTLAFVILCLHTGIHLGKSSDDTDD